MRSWYVLTALVSMAILVGGLSGCEQAGDRVASGDDMDCSATCEAVGDGSQCLATCEGHSGESETTVTCTAADHDGQTCSADCPHHTAHEEHTGCPAVANDAGGSHDADPSVCPGSVGKPTAGCPKSAAGTCPKAAATSTSTGQAGK